MLILFYVIAVCSGFRFLNRKGESTNNLALANKPTPVSKTFENTNELLESPFWENLINSKDTGALESTVIYIEELNSVYHFKSSQYIKAQKKRHSGRRFRFKKASARERVEMVEVQYGEGKSANLNNVPISNCVSSVLSSGGASYSLTYTWKSGLTVTLSPKIAVEIASLGITLTANNDALSLSYSTVGGISCNAPAGGKVQVFSSIKYKYFPEAKKRDVTFLRGNDDFTNDEWANFESDNPKYKSLGPVFFDLSAIPQAECVTEEDDLQCEDYQQNTDMHAGDDCPFKSLTFATLKVS